MCQHFPGGAAEPDHPRFPPEGRCEAPGAHVAGQEPECQRDGHWSAQVSRRSTAEWTGPTEAWLFTRSIMRVLNHPGIKMCFWHPQQVSGNFIKLAEQSPSTDIR